VEELPEALARESFRSEHAALQGTVARSAEVLLLVIADRVERVAPVRVGQGNTTYEVSDELLEALTDAYREAALGKIGG